MSEFNQALEEGNQIEQQVLEILRVKYPCAVKIPGKFKDYDIYVPEINKSVEVKSCPSCHKYGNIVIEIEMFGKPSGLLHSKADYWVIYDGNIFRIMTKNDILHCIFMSQLTYREFVGDGDTNPKKAFLVPADKLLKYGKELL